MCVCVCERGTRGGGGQKIELGSLELELQAVVSPLTRMVGTKLRAFARAALNH